VTAGPSVDGPAGGASTSAELSATGSDSEVGRTDLGLIRVGDEVVAKIAARAAAEISDAGAAATRVLGRAVPGAGRLGGRGTDLDALPKATADVDGSLAYVTLELSVRWPASVPQVAGQVRAHVRDRVQQLTGLTVPEVQIAVADLVTDIPTPSRVQ
jgi:uncharacterized alkaline shock family protein YloU